MGWVCGYINLFLKHVDVYKKTMTIRNEISILYFDDVYSIYKPQTWNIFLNND